MHILGVGAIAVDDLLMLDSHPASDSKMPVRERRREGGGLCATALVAARRLEVPCAFAGVLGTDELSRFSIEQLEREGVDCSRVLIESSARPRYSVILVSRADGGRCILSSKEGVVALLSEQAQTAWLDGCRALLVDHTEAAASLVLAREARRCGIPVIADIERADEDAIFELMRAVDHLIIGLPFAQRLTGKGEHADVLGALQNFSPDFILLCVTDGPRGCHYLHSGMVGHQPAFAVQAVDTTGCGDAFHGSYAAALAQGFDVPTALRRASAGAALCATQPGGRAGLPTRAILEAFLRPHPADG